MAGNLKGYDCKKCLNKGYIARLTDYGEVLAVCECQMIRKTLRRIGQSGLTASVREKTFKSFEAVTDFQIRIKNDGVRFVKEHNGRWFFIGGQNGCGKTHICTAISGQLLKQGKSLTYMLWIDEAAMLKSKIFDSEFSSLISSFQTAEVLYIDDLFKGNVTDQDIRIAYSILDSRYRNRLCTIISSERTLDEIYGIDAAVGGRIAENAFIKINVPKDKSKDYRLNHTA